MVFAAVEIFDPSSIPKIGISWSKEEKFLAIKSWIEVNFEEHYEPGFELPNGDEPENTIELQDEFDLEGLSTAEILRESFSDVLFAAELDEFDKRITEELEVDDWYPASFRIEVSVDLFDEAAIEFDTLKAMIPDLRQTLGDLREMLEDSRGHNKAPSEVVGLDKVEEIDAGLAKLESFELGHDDTFWLAKFSRALIGFGKNFGAHLVEMSQVGSLKFAESFGESAGKTLGGYAPKLALFAFLGEKLLSLI